MAEAAHAAKRSGPFVKRSFDGGSDPLPERPSLLSRFGRSAATGLGGAVGAYAAHKLMPSLPEDVASSWGRKAVTRGLGSALGAGLGNYAYTGHLGHAGIAAAGAGLGGANVDMANQYGAGAALGGVLADTGVQAMYHKTAEEQGRDAALRTVGLL